MRIGSSMDLLAAAGLAGLLFIKEAGVPIPIPGDLLVIGAGVATAGDPVNAVAVLALILVAGYVGGSIQFLIARGALRRPLMNLLTRVGVPQARIESLADRLRRGGARSVAIARATPGVRVPAIAASGLAALPMPSFAPGLVIGNTLFVGAHFALGFIVGLPAVALIQAAGPQVLVGVFVALALLGAVAWLVVRRRRADRPASGRDSSGEAGYGAWADAACPACFGFALLER
jgi:membrane protein DedA with SNARE-associated domain